jgi:hypothetical protein
MSLKRSSSMSMRGSSFGTGDPGAKVGRQELFDHLKKAFETKAVFTPVDVALAIGAGEPQAARALLGLAIEGCVEKIEAGKYRVAEMFGEVTIGDFVKIFSRASKVDPNRQREVGEIQRLKQNNDTMRARLLQAIAERDHYLAALKKAGIDPGPPPPPAPPVGPPAAPAAAEAAAPEAAAEGAGSESGAG